MPNIYITQRCLLELRKIVAATPGLKSPGDAVERLLGINSYQNYTHDVVHDLGIQEDTLESPK